MRNKVLRFVILLGVVGVPLALGGAHIYRSTVRAAEKREALELAASGSIEEARAALLKCLDREPDDPELLKGLVETLVRAKALAPEIEPYAARWSRAQPDDLAALRIHLRCLQQLQDFEQAVRVSERIVELTPDDAAARQTLCMQYLAVGRFDDARRECLRLLEGGSRAELQLLRGRIELGRGDLPAAATALDSVLTATPDDSTALLFRGTVHVRAGEFPQAIALLKRAKPQDDALRAARLNELGLALSRSNHPDEAKAVFEELKRFQEAAQLAAIARTQPKELALNVRAAQALLVTNQPEDARDLLQASLRQSGDDRAALMLLADCQARLGQNDLARQARERAARLK